MKQVDRPFTDAELQDLARMARGFAQLRHEDAKRQAGSSVAGHTSQEAHRFEDLALKCDRMRIPRTPDNVVRLKPGADHVCDRNGPQVEVAMDAPTCSRCGVPQVFD
jgi:hypothetical protein